jgi:hypothetical protein
VGHFMREHDIYVGTMLDDLNLRFAPPHGAKEHFGGIEEMVQIQKEFGIFKQGRSLRTSAMALHLGNSANHEVKNRFYAYLANLRRQKSNVKGLTGEAAIVAALIKNLGAKNPLPAYFDFHDMRVGGESKGVIVREKGRPLFYMDQDYLWISLPTQPHTSDMGEAAPAKKARKK